MSGLDQQTLRHARERAIAEEVLSLLRHDIRNRLLTIQNAMTYVRKRVSATDLWTEDKHLARFVDMVGVELETTDAMLEDNATVKTPPPGEPTCTVGPLVEALPALIGPATPERVTCHVSDEGARVNASELDVAVAIAGVIENALEASPATTEVLVEVVDRGAHVAVVVVDSGPGFDEDSMHAMRQPFATTKEGRLGVGLNIAERRLRRTGGTLEITPGSNGNVTLSFAKAPSQRHDP